MNIKLYPLFFLLFIGACCNSEIDDYPSGVISVKLWDNSNDSPYLGLHGTSSADSMSIICINGSASPLQPLDKNGIFELNLETCPTIQEENQPTQLTVILNFNNGIRDMLVVDYDFLDSHRCGILSFEAVSAKYNNILTESLEIVDQGSLRININ